MEIRHTVIDNAKIVIEEINMISAQYEDEYLETVFIKILTKKIYITISNAHKRLHKI